MSLSKREKILLFALAVIAVVFLGGRFLILPAVNDVMQKQTALRNGSDETQQKQLDVARAGGIQKQYDDALQKAVDTAQTFFPNLKSDDLNKWMKSMADKYKISVGSMTFSDPKVVSIAGSLTASQSGADSYPIRQFAEAFRLGTGVPSSSSSAASSSSASSAVSADDKSRVLESDIVMEIAGTKSAVEAFLDAFPNCGRTAAVTAADGTGVLIKTQSSGRLVQIWSFNVTVSCFSVEKLDPTDQTVTWDGSSGV